MRLGPRSGKPQRGRDGGLLDATSKVTSRHHPARQADGLRADAGDRRSVLGLSAGGCVLHHREEDRTRAKAAPAKERERNARKGGSSPSVGELSLTGLTRRFTGSKGPGAWANASAVALRGDLGDHGRYKARESTSGSATFKKTGWVDHQPEKTIRGETQTRRMLWLLGFTFRDMTRPLRRWQAI